jgi:hypothetical protein
MTDDVTLMIRCDRCEQAWEIDYEPETCECDSDNEWELLVVPNE